MARQRSPRPTRRRRRTWLIVGVVVLVLAVAGGVFAWRSRTTDAAASTTERTVEVSAQTIKDTVGTTGTVEPKQKSELSFASSGTVTKVLVDVGDKVTKGQKLATIDDDALQADVAAAEADEESAEDDLTTAQDATDTTAAELKAAGSKVTVAENAVTSAKTALKAATLRSPIAGTVALVGIAKGDTVGSTSAAGGGGASTSSSSSASSTAAITVISTGSYTVDTSVGSADLAKIKKGLQAQITTTGSTETVYGTVSSVAVMASTSGSTTSGSSATFDVTIDVTGKPTSLYAGASATVSIIVEQRDNVLTVPTAAISTVGGKTVVTTLANGTKTQTPITLGTSYGAVTEVTKGLAAGDQVVVAVANRAPGGAASGRGTGQTGQGGCGGGTGTGQGGFGGGTGTGQGGFGGGAGFPGAGTGAGAGAGGQTGGNR